MEDAWKVLDLFTGDDTKAKRHDNSHLPTQNVNGLISVPTSAAPRLDSAIPPPRYILYTMRLPITRFIHCKGVDAPPCHAVFPEKSEDGSPPTIQFKNIQHLMKAPYVIYADTESIIKPTASSTTDSNTVQTSEHVPCSFAYTVVRSDGQVMSEKLYRGEDAMDVFFNSWSKNWKTSERI